MTPPRHTAPAGSAGRGRRTDPRSGARGPVGPPRRPTTSRPPDPDPARQAALDLLAAVRDRGAYANLALGPILREAGLHGRDAALATELAYGSCRTLGQLDAVVAACGDRPLAELDGPVVDALRLGAYQLLRTRIPSHAAVSATVDLVRAGPVGKAAGYVNAVLRRVSAADLDTWVERLRRPRRPGRQSGPGDRAPPVDRAGDSRCARRRRGSGWVLRGPHRGAHRRRRRPAVHLVARPGRIDRDELVAQSRGTPGRFSPYGVYLDRGDPGRLPAVADRRAAVQDEGSQLVAIALLAAPLDGHDRRWLDLAAGPGGKAGLLGAAAAERGARVDAVEQSPHRADLVRPTTAGLPVQVHIADGRDPGLPAASYDRVLLDAPCTGLGALRRRPEARWRRSASDVAALVRLQRELLVSAAAWSAPAGWSGT